MLSTLLATQVTSEALRCHRVGRLLHINITHIFNTYPACRLLVQRVTAPHFLMTQQQIMAA
jgi:hypothetical protein